VEDEGGNGGEEQGIMAEEAREEVGRDGVQRMEEGGFPQVVVEWFGGISCEEDVGSEQVGDRRKGRVLKKLKGGLSVIKAVEEAVAVGVEGFDGSVEEATTEGCRADGLSK
jgi:hypothetical protein